MQDFLAEAQGLADSMTADRRWLHQHPEVGFDLPETTAYVKARLCEMGYAPTELVPGGLVATVGRTDGPCYLLRADMDALPLREETGLPFASANGNMHACGHDLHTAMLLGAARLLKDHEDELGGCVKLMFQPDEEATAPGELLGGQSMIDAGLLADPTVGAASAIHVNTMEHPLGTVGASRGTAALSIDDVDVRVTGRGTHGASPEQGVDPINIACHIHIALQELLAREVSPYETACLTFGLIQGGSAANIIPEEARLLGTLRCAGEDQRARLQAAIRRTVVGVARAFGGEADVRFLRGLSNVWNDPALTDELCGYVAEGTGVEPHDCLPLSGSDDFCAVSHAVPSTYFLLGAAPAGERPWPLHSSHIVFDEAVMPLGAALHVSCALGWLRRHGV